MRRRFAGGLLAGLRVVWPILSILLGLVVGLGMVAVFLTMETAQYYMAHIARPLLDEGYFASVTIDRNRLYAQILDNLNKSAAIGFPQAEIAERLGPAWRGYPARRRVVAVAQDCALRFREFCLRHNLLDFSLQMDFFGQQLWPDELVREYLGRTLKHVIYDNIEEDIPRAHDLLRDWSAELDSLLLIQDEDGGYRRFLGADPDSARALGGLCNDQVRWEVHASGESCKISTCPGIFLAGADLFTASIFGKGGHGGAPHETIDPIHIAGHVILAINAIISRRIPASESAVISLGTIQGGTADTSIPGQVNFSGTTRYANLDVRKKTHEELEKAFSIAKSFGGDYVLEIKAGSPPTINDARIVENIFNATEDLFGREQIEEYKPIMAGDDFAQYARLVPAHSPPRTLNADKERLPWIT